MGLLERINELGLNDTDNVTILADGDYVIFEEKNEKCLGMYKVYDTRGYEVLFRTTELTKQDIISVSELKELAKGFVINTTCKIGCSNTIANGKASTAMGNNTQANGDYSIAMGNNNLSAGIASFTEGSGNVASGDYSIALGYGCKAISENSTCIGNHSEASGEFSTAIGPGANSIGTTSLALGISNKSIGEFSTAIGHGAISNAESSVSIGTSTVANGISSTAMGNYTTASGEYSTAMGTNITVHKANTLGNGGPIYGEELYSRLLDISTTVPSYHTLKSYINNLHIYNSSTENHFTISGDSINDFYFNRNMISNNIPSTLHSPANDSPINTVNITQIVYTLVGLVKYLVKHTEEQQTTIQNLTSRLDILEST